MALQVDATFIDGVFVPAQRPNLVNQERVRLTIEPNIKLIANPKGEGVINPGSRTDHNLATALDFHPDGC
jgi:hypothetical protein